MTYACVLILKAEECLYRFAIKNLIDNTYLFKTAMYFFHGNYPRSPYISLVFIILLNIHISSV